MPTVINNPSTTDSDASGVNWLVALLLIVALFFLLFYGLPALRGGTTFFSVPSSTSTPSGGNSINVDVPKEINVNTNGTAPSTGQ